MDKNVENAYRAIKKALRRGCATVQVIKAGEALLPTHENRELRMDLAQCCINNGNFAGGIVHLRRALELDPKDDPYVWGKIGTAELRQKNFDAAEHAFRQEVEKAPDEWKYLAKVSLAKVAATQKKYAVAEQIIDETLRDHPEAQGDRIVHTFKASILTSMGRLDEAQDSLDAASAIGRRGRDDRLPRQQGVVDRGFEKKGWGQEGDSIGSAGKA